MDWKYLHSILCYDPCIGEFIWKFNPNKPKQWNSRYAGKRAGTIRICNGTAYRVICIDYRFHYEHRLAWLYVYGYTPDLVDHRNRDGLDNCLNNLREATKSQNAANSDKPVKGIYLQKGRYRAIITVRGNVICLGAFDTKEEAREVYDEAAIKHFGEFARCLSV